MGRLNIDNVSADRQNPSSCHPYIREFRSADARNNYTASSNSLLQFLRYYK